MQGPSGRQQGRSWEGRHVSCILWGLREVFLWQQVGISLGRSSGGDHVKGDWVCDRVRAHLDDEGGWILRRIGMEESDVSQLHFSFLPIYYNLKKLCVPLSASLLPSIALPLSLFANDSLPGIYFLIASVCSFFILDD